MSNIIERHPGYTLLLVTISVMTITWAILTFVLEDNKVNFYKAQIESVKAEAENFKSENSSYKSKIEFLEKENAKLNSINQVYFNYIEKDPNAIIFLQKRLDDLTEQNLLLKNGSSLLLDSAFTASTINSTYNVKAEISRGEAYFDEVTGLVIGLNEINYYRQANVNFTLPGKEEKRMKVEAGSKFEFKSKMRNYELIIIQVDYYSNQLTIQIKED